MRLRGAIDIAAPVEMVWSTVTNPLPLAACVPGVSQMEQLDASTFRGTIVVSLGPAAGSFEFTSQIGDLQPPETFVATVQGRDSVTGSPVEVVVRTRLHQRGAGTTRLEYDAAVAMTGRIAILGEMVLRAAAGVLIGEVTRCLRARLESPLTSA
jgi:carbon monoxide dehydrogenase subunit G